MTVQDLLKKLTDKQVKTLLNWQHEYYQDDDRTFPDMDDDLELRDKLYELFKDELFLHIDSEPYNAIWIHIQDWDLDDPDWERTF